MFHLLRCPAGPLPQLKEKTTMKDRCKDCKKEMTWASQKTQLGRLIRRGLAIEKARAILPRCQKCVTRAMIH